MIEIIVPIFFVVGPLILYAWIKYIRYHTRKQEQEKSKKTRSDISDIETKIKYWGAGEYKN